MKEVLKDTLMTNIKTIFEKVDMLELALEELSLDENLSNYNTNFKEFCKQTYRDFEDYDDEDLRDYMTVIMLYAMYQKGLKDGKGIQYDK